MYNFTDMYYVSNINVAVTYDIIHNFGNDWWYMVILSKKNLHC